jgi:hypothetical protein
MVDGIAGMNTGSLILSFDLATSIPAVAPKRKTQIGGRALHILRGGKCAPRNEPFRLARMAPMG